MLPDGIIFEIVGTVMRKLVMILALSLVGGCASKHLPQTLHTPHLYQEATATSLAFSPPIAQGEPAVMLPRDQRQPGVFIGFEDVTASYFYIRTDDRMTNDGTDHYVRRAIVEKIGVSYR
ncbi:MAG TPA: hypothetical protein VGQ99_18770 [Tepidisphaeraceae bacterium]|nr:hypothetical protein [Tepidisphaeraceae bacterium]